MARRCFVAAVAVMLGALATTAGAQTAAGNKLFPQTIAGHLERWDAGTYFLIPVDSRMASTMPHHGSMAANRTFGANDMNGASMIQIVGLLPPGVSLRPFVGQEIELTGILHEEYGSFTLATPALEMLDWTRLPADVQPVKVRSSCLCE